DMLMARPQNLCDRAPVFRLRAGGIARPCEPGRQQSLHRAEKIVDGERVVVHQENTSEPRVSTLVGSAAISAAGATRKLPAGRATLATAGMMSACNDNPAPTPMLPCSASSAS